MKKQYIPVIAGLVIAAGVGTCWAFGNQPEITYYPDGKIKSTAQRSFFVKNGDYKVFNQDGSVAQEYVLKNGKKVGVGKINGKDISIEVNYVDGKLSGPVKFIGKDFELPEGASVTAQDNVITFTYKDEDGKAEINSKMACNDEEYMASLQSLMQDQNADTVKSFLKCNNLTQMDVASDSINCTYSGQYQFPNFMEASKLSCGGFMSDDVSGYVPVEELVMFDPKSVKDLKLEIGYEPNGGKNVFSLLIPSQYYEQTQDYYGLDKMVEPLIDFAFSEQDTQDLVKLGLAFVKEFSFGDGSYSIKGHKLLELKGRLNLLDGFSNPWTMSSIAYDGNKTFGLKVNGNGIVMNAYYPVTKKPMMSFNLQINDVFKKKYKEMMQTIVSEFTDNSMEKAQQHLMLSLPGYAMEMKDVFKSAGGALLNGKGEKVITAAVSMKPGAKIEDLIDDPTSALNFKVITYKNDQQNQVIEGNMADGFNVNGQKVPFEQLESVVDMDAISKDIEAVGEEIQNQVREGYEIAMKNKKEKGIPLDPFMGGFYHGFNEYAAHAGLGTGSSAPADDEDIDEEINQILDDIDFNDEDKADIKADAETPKAQDVAAKSDEEALAELLQKHPELVAKALDNYQLQQQKEADKRQAEAALKYINELNNADNVPFVGPKDAKVTVVEFFDFSCGYCKKLAPEMEKVIAANRDVKFVFKPLAFVSPYSNHQAKAGFAAHKQGRFLTYYKEIMNAPSTMTAESVDAAVASLGLDMDKYKADIADENHTDLLNNISVLTQKLSVNGVPTLFVNGKMIRAQTAADIQKEIDAAKQ